MPDDRPPLVTGPLDAVVGLSLAIGEAKRALAKAEDIRRAGGAGAPIGITTYQRHAAFWLRIADLYLPDWNDVEDLMPREPR